MDGTVPWGDEEMLALFDRCSNRGRWGSNDELGTLNYISAEKVRAAARLVRSGEVVSLGLDLSTTRSRKNLYPAVHMMLYEQHSPISALDFFGVASHGVAVTHVDAVGHVYFRNLSYNGRTPAEVVTKSGLSFGSVYAQRSGIVTRGVFLDVAQARGVRWLNASEFVTVSDLEAAERMAGLHVEEGDAIFVRVGLEAREAVEGLEDPTVRCGLHAECLDWLHERRVAVYSGDCMERMPYPSAAIPLPLHQVGLAAMGLGLLDCPTVAGLAETCRTLERYEFLLTVAPLRLPGGTGSPVNPLAIF